MEALQQCLIESALHIAPWRTPDRVKQMYRVCLQSQWHCNGEELLNQVERGAQGLDIAISPYSSVVFTSLTVRSTLIQNFVTPTNLCLSPTLSSCSRSNSNNECMEEYDFEKDASVAFTPQGMWKEPYCKSTFI